MGSINLVARVLMNLGSTLPMAHGKHGAGGSQCISYCHCEQAHRWQSEAGRTVPLSIPQPAFCLVFSPLCPVKIVLTRTLLITADLLVGLALVTLLLGLDCTKFLKEDPCIKLKMCYGAGVILGFGGV